MKNSVFLYSEKDKHGRKDVVAIHKFFERIQIGKTNYDVIILIFETTKTYLYDHILLKEKIGDAVGSLGAITHFQPFNLHFTDFSYPKGEFEISVINNQNQHTPVSTKSLSGVVGAQDIIVTNIERTKSESKSQKLRIAERYS